MINGLIPWSINRLSPTADKEDALLSRKQANASWSPGCLGLLRHRFKATDSPQCEGRKSKYSKINTKKTSWNELHPPIWALTFELSLIPLSIGTRKWPSPLNLGMRMRKGTDKEAGAGFILMAHVNDVDNPSVGCKSGNRMGTFWKAVHTLWASSAWSCLRWVTQGLSFSFANKCVCAFLSSLQTLVSSLQNKGSGLFDL